MKYLSQYTEQAQSEAFTRHGAFFAFSDKQFDEVAVKGVTYVNVGGGLLSPKENAKKLIEDINKAQVAGIKADVEDNGAEGILHREFFNYETQIMDNGDYDDEAKRYQKHFPEAFTDELIKRVKAECWEEAIKDDLF